MTALRTYSFYLMILVCLLLDHTVKAQTGPGKFNVTHFGEEEGLPQNTVNDMLPDQNGFLWVATESGICQFNGNRFIPVSAKPEIGTTNFSRIKSFYYKGKDTIIAYSAASMQFATILNDKIISLESSTRNKKGLLFGMRHNNVTVPSNIAEDSGHIQAQWDISLGSYNGYIYHKNHIAVTLSDGIGFYNSNGQVEKIKISDFDPYRVLYLDEQVVYADAANYIHFYSPTGEQQGSVLMPIKQRLKFYPNTFGSGFFCIADAALYSIQLSSTQQLIVRKILTGLQNADDIKIIYEKDNSTIVTGTSRNGLYVYKKCFFSISEPLPKGELDVFYVQRLMEDNETILAGKNKLFKDGRYIGKTKEEFITHDYSSLKDSKGNYWYVNNDVLLKAREIGIKPETLFVFTGSPGILFEDRQQNVWFSSSEHFGYFQNNRFIELKLKGLAPSNISYMAQDSAGRYLIGTSKGLFILNNIKETVLQEIPSLRSVNIRFIWPEANGQIWVCTYGDGFFLVLKDKVIRFPESKERLAFVHYIAEDGNGNFWMPTNNGLFVASRRSLMAYAENNNKIPFYYLFTKKNGLRTNEFNGGTQPAFLRLPDGTISLASMQGLVQIEPKTVEFDFSSSPIQIDNIQLDSNDISQLDEFDVKSKISNIGFSISNSFWGEKENELVEYQVVEKGDTDEHQWLQVDALGKINLFTPSYGHYQLMIRKRTGLNENDYLYKVVNFHVLPKWYQTKFFLIAALIGIVLLIIAALSFRKNYYRRANQVMKEKVAIATAALQQANDTLERKVTERTVAIQQAEIRFRTLVEGSLVGVYIVQGNKFIYVNPRFEEILGYDPGELLGNDSLSIINESQRNIVAEKVRSRISGEVSTEQYEIAGIKKDGSSCQLEFFGSSTIYEGKPTVIGTMLDITERTKIGIELKEAETKFRDLVEKSLAGVYIIKEGKFVYVNPRFAEIFGYDQKELTDSPTVDIVVYEPDREIVLNNIKQRMSGEFEGVHYEVRGEKKDGTLIYTELFGRITQFEGGPAIIGTLIDITAKKIAEEQLTKEKDLSQSIINNLPGIFYIFDAAGNHLLWNKNFETITGYTGAEIAASPAGSLTDEKGAVLLHEAIKKVYAEGFAEVEAPLVCKDGKKFHYYYNGITVDYKDKPCILGVAIDITELKKAEQERAHANYMLNERIKELTTLYRAGVVLQEEERPIIVTLNDLVSILPSGWQYSDITAARVSLGEMEFTTQNFKTGIASQTAEFSTAGGAKGKIEVVYLEECPIEDEGPFLKEERNLIDMLADMLRIHFTKREAIKALQKSEANLHTVFDTTDTVYALLNEKFQVIAFNQRAADFSEREFKQSFRLNSDLVDYFPENRKAILLKNMRKVRAGDHISYEINYPQPDGKLNWYYVRMFPITNAEKMIFGMMMALSDITEKKRLEQEILDQKVQEQKMMIRAILIGEERERNKIGQELHDNVGQILAGTRLYLSTAKRSKEGGQNIINESMELISSAMDEIRALSKGKVTPLKKVNLEEMLLALLENLSTNSGIKTTLTFNGTGQIEDDLKLNIYRIIQEQLNNILKHSNAKNVTVLVDVSIKNIFILVKDDGKGFDPDMKKDGIGISNMTNRVESFNGTITIESSPGNGCNININLPV